MLEELDALIRIAAIDTKAFKAQAELDEIPERLAELEADVGNLGGLLEAERQELEEADRLLAAQQAEIDASNDSLAKSKSKGARARNMREADAVERELEVIRRTLKEREAERETLQQALAKRREGFEKHQQDFDKLQAFLATERAKGETRMGELRAKLDTALAGREEAAAKVPGDMTRRYNLIRKRRAGVAVAYVKAGSCSGCNVGLRPMQVIAIEKGESFESCPQCSRFLLPGHPPPAEPEAVDVPAAAESEAEATEAAEPAAPDA